MDWPQKMESPPQDDESSRAMLSLLARLLDEDVFEGLREYLKNSELSPESHM
jgi:hypothetical protein